MKISGCPILASMCSVALIAAGCNYAKPVMYIDIVNHSGAPMKNIELKHPTGSFGVAELRDEQTHRRMEPLGTPCQLRIAFEDQAGRKYTHDYDLGAKCPTEIAFEVDPGMNVSERQLRP